MDQKSWPWKKKTAEIITLRPDKANNSFSGNEEVNEVQELLDEKAELERSLRISNEKLSAAVADCNAKDIITKKQVKIAQEAIAGWEKADGEAMSLKEELDKVLLQKAASEQRLSQLDAALKECMQQLRFVRDEQDKKIHAAVLKTSEDFEKNRITFDKKLSEADHKLAKLEADNTQLWKALSGKEKVIKELSQYRADVEADFNSLMSRVESTKKENTSLKYEVRVLEKELDIRNEEREFIRRTADVASRQQQESVKKVANLEAECQKLRLLVRKRLPGPAALARMKNEVSMLGNDYVPSRRKSNLSLINSEHDARINFLIEHLQKLEEENRSLKMLHLSKLSRIETNTEQGHLVEKNATAMSDMGSDDKASCAESWASPSHRNVGTSEMSLMDDFAEMEKLAVVSVDYPPESSNHSSDEGPLPEQSEPLIRSGGEVLFDDIQKMLVEYCQESQRNPVEVLNDIKVALSQNKLLNFDASDNENHCISSSMKIDGQKTLDSCVTVSIHKILELFEGINVTNEDNGLSYKNSEPPTGYMVRAFQWKSDEICAILQRFVQNCNDLLGGTATLEHFVQEVATNLDWVMNHCFSIQDVSSMKDAIRNHLDWDDSRSDSEVDCGSVNHSNESNNRLLSPLSGCNSSSRIEVFQHNDAEEEDKSVHMIENSQSENKVLMHSEEKTVDIVDKEKTVKEVEFQQADTRIEHRKLCEKISQLENELENKNQSCQKLEETCNDLKIELESMPSKEVDVNGEQWEKQRRNDLEITAASEKIAECQETILNLGMKLKAMATPKEAALFDKVISSPAYTVPTNTSTPHRDLRRRSSLLDKMLSEDNEQIVSSRSKDNTQTGNSFSSVSTSTNAAMGSTIPNGDDCDEPKTPDASTAIEPYKKSGGRSLFKKLFTRAKKGKSKKASLF